MRVNGKLEKNRVKHTIIKHKSPSLVFLKKLAVSVLSRETVQSVSIFRAYGVVRACWLFENIARVTKGVVLNELNCDNRRK